MKRMATYRIATILLAFGVLAIAGCGGEESASNGYGGTAGAAPRSSGSEAPAGGPVSVLDPAVSAGMSMPSASSTTGARAAPAATFNANMYVSSNYIGGSGARDRLEKLVSEGVLVEGKRVRLEAFSRNYAQAFPIPTKTSLAVAADPEHTKIVEEGGRTFLQVGLQASKGEAPRRPALNVALVIDVSGSMASEGKMEFAKDAAMRLVDRLNPEDVLSVVSFDGAAKVVARAQQVVDRDALKRKIEQLRPGNNTNIFDGLKLGYREARKFSQREGVNLVILLSDGEVTAGVTDQASFQALAAEQAESDIQTTSVGLGVAYNEELMLAIAREGKGNYHFIKDGAGTEVVFKKELDELTQVVAQAVKLRIKLAEGVGLVRVLGSNVLSAAEAKQVRLEEKRIDQKVLDELGITTDRNKEDEPGIKMLIPNFYRGDNHVVMLEIEVAKGRGTRPLADVYLKYKDLPHRTNRSQQLALRIQHTPDRSAMIASTNQHVKKNLLGFQTGEALMQSASLLEQGRAAEAVKLLDERMEVLGVAAKVWKDRDLDRDGRLLARYKSVVTECSRNPQVASDHLGDYVRKSMTYAGYQMTR